MAAVIFSLILIGAGGIFFLFKRQDHSAPQNGVQPSRQEEPAQAVAQATVQPQIGHTGGHIGGHAGGPAAAPATKPIPAPPKAFKVNCADCHGSEGQGGDVGPRLAGVTAKAHRHPKDLEKLLEGPRAFGLRPPMPESFPSLSEEDKRQIIEWLNKLQGPRS